MRKWTVVLGIARATSLLAFGWLRQDEITHTQKHFHLSMFVGEQNGYILTPPEFVAQPFIRHIHWSPDGNYAILVQTALRFEGEAQAVDVQMRHRVLAWSRKTKRVSVLWESDLTTVDIEPEDDVRVAFYKDTPTCLFAVRESRFKNGVHSVSWGVYHAPLNGRPTKLGAFGDVHLLAPPEDTVCYLIWHKVDPETASGEYFYAPVSSAGRLGEPLVPPPSVKTLILYSTSLGPEEWFADGKQVVATILPPPAFDESDEGVVSDESGKKVVRSREIRYVLWNPRTNQELEITRSEVRLYEPKTHSRLKIELAQKQIQHQQAQGTVQTAWLGEGEETTLVAADSGVAAVSPQGDALLYVAHGAAFYRTLITMPREDLAQMIRRAEIEQYTENARQIGIALMMYVQDYDETFPHDLGNQGVAEILSPYLKDSSAFEVDGAFAFHYLMNGQKLTDLSNPVETVVGYLQLPDGRVVIYADGHVKWRPNR